MSAWVLIKELDGLKAGTRIETTDQFDYFYSKYPAHKLHMPSHPELFRQIN